MSAEQDTAMYDQPSRDDAPDCLGPMDIECPVCECAPGLECESWDSFYHDYRPMGIFGPHQERIDRAEATPVCPDCGEIDTMREASAQQYDGEVNYTLCAHCGWKGNARGSDCSSLSGSCSGS